MNEGVDARPEGPAVSEPLSWDEICRQYPDQWVAIAEIDWIEDADEFRSARVVGHGPRRRDPLVQARRGRYHELGHFFTGRVRGPLRDSFAL